MVASMSAKPRPSPHGIYVTILSTSHGQATHCAFHGYAYPRALSSYLSPTAAVKSIPIFNPGQSVQTLKLASADSGWILDAQHGSLITQTESCPMPIDVTSGQITNVFLFFSLHRYIHYWI